MADQLDFNALLQQIVGMNAPATSFSNQPIIQSNFPREEQASVQKQVETSADLGAEWTPKQKKILDLQDTYGPQGFQFSLNEKGNVEITNTEATRAAAKLTSPSGDPGPTGVAATVAAMQSTTEPAARMALLQNLQIAGAEAKAKFWNDSMQTASIKLGIPSLESALAQNEAADRSDPRWSEFQVDSPATKQARAQLAQARGQMDELAKSYLAGNVGYASLNAQLTTAAKIAERQEKLAETADQFKLQKQFTQQMKREEEDQLLLQKVGDQAISNAAIIKPELAGKSAIEVARNIAYGIKDRSLQEAIIAPAEDLPKLAFGQDNVNAAKLLLKQEAERTGTPELVIADQMKAIQRTMTNDKVLREAVTKVYKGDKAQQESFNQMLSRASVGGTKADQEAAAAAKYQVALAVQSQIATNKFMSDVGTWKGYVDPEIQTAVQKSKEITGSTSMNDVLTQYLGESKGPERRMKVDAFISGMRQAVDAGPGKSLIASVDPRIIGTEIQRLAIGKSILNKTLDAASYVLQGTINDINLVNPIAGAWRLLDLAARPETE